MHILASKNAPFTLTTVQVPNLALTHKKRITVHARIQQTIESGMDPANNVVRDGPIKQCSQAWIQHIMLNVIDSTSKAVRQGPSK